MNEDQGPINLHGPQFAPKPWATRADRLVDQALEVAKLPIEEIQAMRPIARPQRLFPSKSGIRSSWTIGSVLNIDRQRPLYRSWRSGMEGDGRSNLGDTDSSIESSSRNASTQIFGGM